MSSTNIKKMPVKPFTYCTGILNLIGDFAGDTVHRKHKSSKISLRFPITKNGNFSRYIHLVNDAEPRTRPRALAKNDWIPLYPKRCVSLRLVKLAYRFINHYTSDYGDENFYPQHHCDDFNNELRILVEKFDKIPAINYGIAGCYPSQIDYVPEERRSDHKILCVDDYRFRYAFRELRH